MLPPFRIRNEWAEAHFFFIKGSLAVTNMAEAIKTEVSAPALSSPSGKPDKAQLIDFIDEILASIELSVVDLEILHGRERKLRIFIDHRPKRLHEARNETDASSAAKTKPAVGIEHCVAATKALDQPLDESPLLRAIFKDAAYELEVSSPGLDRPLRKPSDYDHFAGHRAHIHVFRPLSADELGHTAYQEQNPKQKHFLGILEGCKDGRVSLRVAFASSQAAVTVPLSLISKANLEPDFSQNLIPKHEGKKP